MSCTYKLWQWHPSLPALNSFILAATTDGQLITVPMLVAVLLASQSWLASSAILIWFHTMIYECTLLLFQHNAQMLLACNIFPIIIMLSIMTQAYLNHNSERWACPSRKLHCYHAGVWLPLVNILHSYNFDVMCENSGKAYDITNILTIQSWSQPSTDSNL